MWELDHKENWALKKWHFWTVGLEKTLESPLDCKEIQPGNPKGNQLWIFIGRTDVNAEAPVLWLPDGKSSCCSLSRDQLFVTPWTAACQASLSFATFQSLLKLMSIELVMSSNNLILCHPLLFLPSIFPSIRVFSDESVLHIRWPDYWSFSISLFNEYSGLISFRIDWFDLPCWRRDAQEASIITIRKH